MQLEKFLKRVALAAVFTVPFLVLLVTADLFFPFITGKNIAFRVVVEIAFAAWLILALLNNEYRPRWTLVLISVTAFVAIVAFADVFGANPYKSFWSNFERMEGLITLLHLLAYLVVAGTVLNTEKLWFWFWRISLAVSATVAGHTILQLLLTEKTRLDSTLGNPIFLAIYALFHIFIAVTLATTRENITRAERLTYAMLAPFLFIALVLTATRGATLGLLGGFLVALLGISFSLRSSKYVRNASLIGLLVLILGVSAIWVSRDSSFVQENPTLQRLTNISLSEDTVSSRTILWGIAWKGVKDRPLLGWGQENFNLVFNTYYDPRMYEQETWFDRVHNIFFDWLVAAGFLGLLAYLSIFLSLLWTLYKTQVFSVVQKWLLFGLFVAYGFHNLTVFDNIVSYLLFFSVVAWIHVVARDVWVFRSKTTEGFALPAVLRIPVAIVVGILLVLVVWFVNVPAWQQARGILVAIREVGAASQLAQIGRIDEATARVQKGSEVFRETESIGSLGTQEVRERWADTAGSVVEFSWLSEEVRNEYYIQAVQALGRQREATPEDARFAVLLGALHGKAGDHESAAIAYQEALKLSPNKQKIILPLSVHTLRLGDLEGALRYAKEAYDLDPSFAEPRTIYAILLIRTNSLQEALEVISGDPAVGIDERLLAELVKGDYHNEAPKVFDAGAEAGELQDPIRFFGLSAVYAQQGDFARAIAEVRRVAGEYPEVRPLEEQAIQELQAIRNAQ